LHFFETKIQEKNLEFLIEYDKKIPEVLVGDLVRLHQIILNLVKNAIKFTIRGTIRVSADLLDEDDEKVKVKFSISDTRIGIQENKISNIFDNFQQTNTGTSQLYGGIGLGLVILNQLVEQQGGTTNVESKVDEGSTFSFSLNFKKTRVEAQDVNELMEIETEIKNTKILVVEDIALNQFLMKTMLDNFSFEFDITANGKLAIEKLKQKSYDIILIDLQMPEINGNETNEYIRNVIHSTMPIIALTANVTIGDLAKCRAVGKNDYIGKPMDERHLNNKILSLV
jgi:CheY-like chemotaxis protein